MVSRVAEPIRISLPRRSTGQLRPRRHARIRLAAASPSGEHQGRRPRRPSSSGRSRHVRRLRRAGHRPRRGLPARRPSRLHHGPAAAGRRAPAYRPPDRRSRHPRRHRRPRRSPAAAGAAGGAPTAGAAAADLDEMARRLFEPLSARLRAELWLDRERAGWSPMPATEPARTEDDRWLTEATGPAAICYSWPIDEERARRVQQLRRTGLRGGASSSERRVATTASSGSCPPGSSTATSSSPARSARTAPS